MTARAALAPQRDCAVGGCHAPRGQASTGFAAVDCLAACANGRSALRGRYVHIYPGTEGLAVLGLWGDVRLLPQTMCGCMVSNRLCSRWHRIVLFLVFHTATPKPITSAPLPPLSRGPLSLIIERAPHSSVQLIAMLWRSKPAASASCTRRGQSHNALGGWRYSESQCRRGMAVLCSCVCKTRCLGHR